MRSVSGKVSGAGDDVMLAFGKARDAGASSAIKRGMIAAPTVGSPTLSATRARMVSAAATARESRSSGDGDVGVAGWGAMVVEARGAKDEMRGSRM